MSENRNSVERFLVVHGAGPAWAMRAAYVVRFTTLLDWRGPPPLTVDWSSSPATETASTRCLMVFRTPRGECAVHITGTVTPRDVESAQVCVLLAPCRPGATSDLVISALAIDGNDTLFLIVEPGRGGA